MNRKKVALALGGGAARGLAHIGVLQVFMENNIPIDYVAGCSMGAVIGGIFCTGSDMYKLAQLSITLSEHDILDVTLPKQGLIRGKRTEKMIEMLTKGYTFEQCVIPFAAAACDLTTSSSVTLREGSVARAIRASISLPGVFVPVEWGDMTLVDGGVIHRVPIEIAREMGGEYIIAVDVAFRGWKRHKPANMIETLYQAFETMDWQMTQKNLPSSDLIIAPNVADCDEKNFQDAERCVEAGRVAALSAIARIKQDLGL